MGESAERKGILVGAKSFIAETAREWLSCAADGRVL